MLCRIIAAVGWAFLAVGVSTIESEAFLVPALATITGALLLLAASSIYENETEGEYEQTDTEKARY